MLRTITILALCALSLPPAHAATTKPAGYLLMCLESPAQCVGGDRPVKASAVLDTLTAVNAKVNRTMTERADRGDTWSVNVRFGDCEDFALTKRAALVKAGVPMSAMMIAVVTLPSGEGHAVLVVATDKGKLALDNRRDDILPLKATGYRLVMLLP